MAFLSFRSLSLAKPVVDKLLGDWSGNDVQSQVHRRAK
jgi:hypothetical protein